MNAVRTVTRSFASGLGNVLLAHQALIRRAQWVMIMVYLSFLVIPLLLPLPGSSDYIWNNLSRFVQFVFWGL
jgi:hypothetical protein